jgi:uncharacterized phage infection (PIP) family protein YhgE
VLALVGDDDSVSDFINALTQTVSQANQLSSSLQSIQSNLTSIINVLTYPETVSSDLDNLNTILTTASAVLTAVSIIPEISVEADAINTAIKSLQAEITPAKNAADAIDAEVKPLRDALTQLQSLLGQTISGVNNISSAAQNFLTHFQQIDNCINSLPDGPVKQSGLSYLSSFAATATPYVNTLNSALGTVNGAMSDFYNAVQSIANQLSFLTQISDAINSVLSELSPLIGPLQSLASLLDYKITIPTPVPFYGVTLTIREILDEFQTFIDLAMDILNPILQPILGPLQQLAQSIISQIPGLSQLLNLQITIPGIPDFAGLFGNLSSLLTQLQSALQQFSLTCPPSATQGTFKAQVDAHVKELSRAFESGPLYVLKFGGGQHLSGAGRGGPVFRAQLDLGRRVVLTQAATGKLLAVENGAPVLKAGPVTPASHFQVVGSGRGKFSLKSADGQVLEVDEKSEFKRS